MLSSPGIVRRRRALRARRPLHPARNEAYARMLMDHVPAGSSLPAEVWLVPGARAKLWIGARLRFRYGLRSFRVRPLDGSHLMPGMGRLADDLNRLIPG